MLIEFYPISYKPFVRDIPLPLPTILRIPKFKGGTYASSLEAEQWPPISESKDDYIEFELSTMKHDDFPDTNVFNLPRRAYKEIRIVRRANSNE
jgi:hypothetical protein